MEEKIKLVVWDFDKTLIKGVLSENEDCKIDSEIIRIVKKLDQVGILQSICSRNESNNVVNFLEKKNIAQYFLNNQIGWGMKSDGIRKILLDFKLLGKNTLFVDDQIFEREEVNHKYPYMKVLTPKEAILFFNKEYFSKQIITKETSMRRKMYIDDIQRKEEEDVFLGTHEDFLKSLNMKLKMRDSNSKDLERVFELFERTHQLNSTGIIYSKEEINEKMNRKNEKVLVLSLEDKYGSYGIVGIVVLKIGSKELLIEQFLLSCRIMSRGVGGVVLEFLKQSCIKKKYILSGLYKKTQYNRIMEITYNFNGFKIREVDDSGYTVFENKMEKNKSEKPFINFIYEGTIL